MNTYVIRFYGPQPSLLVGVIEEAGVEEDSKDSLTPNLLELKMKRWSYQKMVMRNL